MYDLTWPATPSSSHAIFHSVGSRYGIREEALVVGLGVLDEAPVIAERLDVRLPDGPDVLLADGPDLEPVRKRVVGEIVDRRPHHVGGVRDRLVAGVTDQRGRGEVPIVRPDLEELLVDVVLARDLAEAGLVPREERRPDAASSELRDRRSTRARRDAARRPPRSTRLGSTRPGCSVHLDDDEVPERIAALEVLVSRRDALGRLDSIVADPLRPGGDDPREVRVVAGSAKAAELDSVEASEALTDAVRH